MTINRRNLLLSGLTLSLGAGRAFAQSTGLKPLTDDVSRADLANYDLKAYASQPGNWVLQATQPNFAFPVDADDGIYGIDLSHHNETFEWSALSPKQTKVGFVYLKASQGTEFVDPKFDRNWKGAGGVAGLKRGAYHFLSAQKPGKAQAEP